MAAQRCPECGGEVPPELGQHSLAPMTGLVNCPHCGAQVKLEKPRAGASTTGAGGSSSDPGDAGVAGEPTRDEWVGHETVEGVMGEIEDKPGGGRS